jgi:general secretion pathway protein N
MSRSQRLVSALLILLAVLAGLIWAFPARWAWAWFGPKDSALRVEGIEGRLWEGRALRVWLREEFLGRLDWTLSPWSLLRGQPELRLRLTGGATTVSAHLVRESAGRIRLPRLHLTLPARLAEPALDIPALVLLGAVEVDLEDVELSRFGLERARGRMAWRNAAVSGAAEAHLGDLHGELEAPSLGRIDARLYDGGGPLALEGRFELRGLRYQAEARLAARDGDPRVREALRFAGEPQEDGSVLYRVEGSVIPPQR